ncbi:MAG: DUF1566 domain-containing protein [Pseudodesulfovibrio sp.]
MFPTVLSTGQSFCADIDGARVGCAGTGQDAEASPGIPWDAGRFAPGGETVFDTATGLTWLRDANVIGFPVAWEEGRDFIRGMNERTHAGHADWRLPDRRELFSLVSFDAHSPALPEGHPFTNVFSGWYWTATPSAMHPAQAWHVHFMGGRMFWGTRTGYELIWPVRGTSAVLPAVTASAENGAAWPSPRFAAQGETALDGLTGLTWTRSADLAPGPVGWQDAFETVVRLNRDRLGGMENWRLPTIRELESLTDAARHSPALPGRHPFADPREAYWSSTNSAYEADWAMCLYLHKGAVGVGFKGDRGFHVWAVTEQARP